MTSKPTNEDFLRAKAAYESQSVADRVAFSNERLKSEGSTWRSVENLPHENLLLRLADDSVKIIPIREVQLGSKTGSSIFGLLAACYTLIPFVATIYFAIHLKQPLILIAIVLQIVAISYVGAPRHSILREILGPVTVVLGLIRGFENIVTLLVGIPAFAAYAFHYSDSFKNWWYIKEIKESDDRFSDQVANSVISVQIDTSRHMATEGSDS
jgi:hypothetical protein